jgi:hypothetical protein
MNKARQRKTAVKYDDLEDAHSFVSDAGSSDAAAYICRESGIVYWVSTEYDIGAEAPENVGDDEKTARNPDKFDLDKGNSLVFRFVRKFIPEHYDGVSAIFRRRGAYARFKDLLFDLGKLDAWYAFENSSREVSLRRWAEGEGFVVEPVAKPHTQRVYQFRIELKDLEPLIWRRIQVPETYSFWDLHVAIQDAMGWLDSHLHAFQMVEKDRESTVLVGIPDEFEPPYARTLPGWETPVADFFHEVGSAAYYEYDFGDGWRHQIVLEAVLLADSNTAYPSCVGGERACPPEDCGGTHGYMRLMHALMNPEEDESKELLDWAGRDFDPDKFAPDDVRFDDPKVRWEKAFNP